MSGVVVVCGTGTEIGKTHFSVALLTRAGRDLKVLGFKPVESGCTEWSAGSDHLALATASTFHVKHLPEYCLTAPISPHLAARREGKSVDVCKIIDRIQAIATGPDVLLVELAGGLFSPLSDHALNADLLRDLQRRVPTIFTVLVAPDRLGVLHDLGASLRAALVADVKLDGIVLSTPAQSDASTGTNGAELALLASLPLLATLPRLPLDTLADHPEIASIYSILLRNFSLPASIK